MLTRTISGKRFSKFILIIFTITLSIYILNTYGVTGLREHVNEMGIFAPGALFLLRFTSVVIPALPSTAYSLLAGGIFGFKKGVLIICISDLLSCSTSFFISRHFGKDIVEKIVGKKFIGKIEDLGRKHLEDNFLLITGILMTGLFDFMSYGIGLTRTSWQKFYPALVISIILSNPPIVALGAGILDGGYNILIFSAIGCLILGLIYSILKSKYLKKSI